MPAKTPLAASLLAAFMLSACSGDHGPPDPRGVSPKETLLSVSATGEAETRPDQAQFQAGVNSWAGDAKSASTANAAKMAEVLNALRGAGVADKDVQTRAVSVQRLDWGDRKGQYQAANVVNVTVRNVDRAGAAVTAATNSGANLLSGPDLRMADPERAANAAYTAAYKAARSRADAYAAAADMRVARVLSIRDSGGAQGNRQLPGAVPVAPPSVVMEQSSVAAGRVMAGQTTSTVAVQVDFALAPK